MPETWQSLGQKYHLFFTSNVTRNIFCKIFPTAIHFPHSHSSCWNRINSWFQYNTSLYSSWSCEMHRISFSLHCAWQFKDSLHSHTTKAVSPIPLAKLRSIYQIISVIPNWCHFPFWYFSVFSHCTNSLPLFSGSQKWQIRECKEMKCERKRKSNWFKTLYCL